MKDKDYGLICRLKEHDDKALEQLYQKYNRLVYFTVYSYVQNADDAKEITNDTFSTIYQKIGDHDEEKTFKYWMLAIAKNKALRYLENRKKEKAKIDEMKNISGEYEEADSLLLANVEKILDRQEYLVFVYKVLYELNLDEIGKLLNISRSNAYRIYNKAIEKLKIAI